MTPYVRMRMSIFGANTDRTKAMVAIILPVIATGRHPNLLVSALTIGPERKEVTLSFVVMTRLNKIN